MFYKLIPIILHVNKKCLTSIKTQKIHREILIWQIITLIQIVFSFEHFLVKYYQIYSLNNGCDVLNYLVFYVNQYNSAHITLHYSFILHSQLCSFREFNLFKILKEMVIFLTHIGNISLKVFYYAPFDIPGYVNY